MKPQVDADLLDILNGVLETTEDARRGYRKAADEVGNPDVEQFLSRKARDRDRFAETLRILIKQRGQEPEEGGTLAGFVHRALIDLRATFASDEGEQYLGKAQSSWFKMRAEQISERSEVVIEECLRGEKHSLDVLRKALDRSTAGDLLDVLEFEIDQVERALRKIESLIGGEGLPDEASS